MKPTSLQRFIGIVCFIVVSDSAMATDWSGEVGIEATAFLQSPQFSGQHDDGNLSLSFQPEYYTSWDNRDQSFEFIPFFRADAQDDERTHADIRELAWTKVYNEWELRVGVSRVFWGVTEFQHLVDVINQTDAVENLDGEDKLGQPMVLLTSIQRWGNLEFYALPYFRERTFAGIDGRLRTPLVIDQDLSSYESSAEQERIDLAIRYSHYIGDWDIGLSHFSGTNREPILEPTTNSSGANVFAPYYELMEQSSIALQATKGETLWKLEALHRIADSGVHNAIAGGLEYSFYGIANTYADLGVLVEYHYDDRGENAPTVFEDDIAIGARLALNDAQSTEYLVGILVDQSSGGNSVSIEGSRRLTNNLFLELESRLFHDQDPEDLAYAITKDDFVRLNLFYNF